MASVRYLITGALLEYAAILMILKTKCIPLRKLQKITNGPKKESMVMTADNLERQRKSIINGTFERASDLEVSMIRLALQLYPRHLSPERGVRPEQRQAGAGGQYRRLGDVDLTSSVRGVELCLLARLPALTINQDFRATQKLRNYCIVG